MYFCLLGQCGRNGALNWSGPYRSSRGVEASRRGCDFLQYRWAFPSVGLCSQNLSRYKFRKDVRKDLSEFPNVCLLWTNLANDSGLTTAKTRVRPSFRNGPGEWDNVAGGVKLNGTFVSQTGSGAPRRGAYSCFGVAFINTKSIVLSKVSRNRCFVRLHPDLVLFFRHLMRGRGLEAPSNSAPWGCNNKKTEEKDVHKPDKMFLPKNLMNCSPSTALRSRVVNKCQFFRLTGSFRNVSSNFGNMTARRKQKKV